MNKEDLKEFAFYHWIEKSRTTLDDVCFVIEINKISSPDNYQCSGIELESIKSDLIVGHSYNYHFYTGERRKRYNVTYKIKEIKFDQIDRKMFFDMLFDDKSQMFLCLNLYERSTKIRKSSIIN